MTGKISVQKYLNHGHTLYKIMMKNTEELFGY